MKESVEKLALGDEATEAIMGRNAATLLGSD